MDPPATRARPVAAPDVPVPPGFDVRGELGRGAGSVVLAARRHGRDVALKILTVAPDDVGAHLRHLRREAALVAAVDHPGVPSILEVGLVSDHPFVVMDLVAGRPLGHVLEHGPLAPADVVRLGLDVAAALSAVHRAGLVHRDLKPANLMVQDDGETRLIDYGFATRRDTGRDGNDRATVGTLAYAPPEQSGMLARPVDARSDLYSLGVVLFQCLTGQPPFDTEDVGELLRMHAVVLAPDLRSLVPSVPGRLAPVVDRLLAKDPDDRYQSGPDLVEDLLAVAADLGIAPVVTGAQARRRTLGGRRREITDLTGRWHRARRGAAGAAIVRGPAGVGKSRLVAHVAAAAAEEGAVVLHGKSSPGERLPLAPFRQAIEQYVARMEHLPDDDAAAAVSRLRDAAGDGARLLSAFFPALAGLLGVQGPGTGNGDTADDADRFTAALVDFLEALARAGEGLLLHLDDLQWLDPASLRVLHGLARTPSGSPLLVIGTARDDPESRSATLAAVTALDGFVDVDLTLPPLDVEGVADLVASTMPGLGDVAGLASALLVRGNGNPFLTGELLRAIVDAGLLVPDWGRWRMDDTGLDALHLPDDALGLVLARVDRLGGRARAVLVAAAVIGTRFEASLLAAVTSRPAADVHGILAEAVTDHLLLPAPVGGYAFVHDCIREALLADAVPPALRRLHLAIATALEISGDPSPAAVHAIAQHYLEAAPVDDVTVRRTSSACRAAGVLALADHAGELALTYLEQAQRLDGTLSSAPVDAGLLALLGTAYQRNRRFTEAVACFEAALETETGALARADVLVALSRVLTSVWQPVAASEAVARGFAELGHPVPRHPALALLHAFRLMIIAILVGVTGWGRGTASGDRRARYERICRLHEVAGYAALLDLDPARLLVDGMRAMFFAVRLGPGPEYVRAYAGFGAIAQLIGIAPLARAMRVRTSRAVRQVGDPRLHSFVTAQDAGVSYISRTADIGPWQRAYLTHGRWLDSGAASDIVSGCFGEEVLRGRTSEARDWNQRALARRPPEGVELDSCVTVPATFDAMLGRFGTAATEFARVEAVAGSRVEPGLRFLFILARSTMYVEQREYGEPFDRLRAELDVLGVSPRTVLRTHRTIYLKIAQLHLGRLRTSTVGGPGARFEPARRAVATFAKVADSPLLIAHLRLAEADLAHLEGRHRAALEILDHLDPLEPDAPLVAFDAALLRARCRSALGHDEEARRAVGTAHAIAVTEQWPHRARWVGEEFPLVRAAAGRTPSQVGSTSGAASPTGLERLRLQALQDVSRAASRQLDPVALARIVLDRTIRILSAERAFLFLVDTAGDLVPFVGRDLAGQEVAELTAYSTTLVERVRLTREPLVMTGTEEGAALGSQSVVLHGLRSILVAPLMLEERLLGVVYLDSQIAKGVFTDDDSEILMAVTTHIATSLETARAAQLKVSVESARRRQELAENLGEALRDMSSTLDPQQVLARLLRAAGRMIPAEASRLVLTGEALLPGEAATHVVVRLDSESTDRTGTDGEGATRRLLTGAESSEITLLLAPDEPSIGGGGPGAGGPEAAWARVVQAADGVIAGPVADGAAADGPVPGSPTRTWLTVPLTSGRGERIGALVMWTAMPGAFGPTDLQVAGTLVAQGVSAYDNATLFARVQELAVVDELTGVANRRRLFEQAHRELAAARRHHASLLVAMVDIDHFKRVNDTYGHPTGDDVIRVVAARLRDTIRGTDIVGRYGGEEFALVLTETAGQEAAGQRLLQAVTSSPIETRSGPLEITVSVGTALLADQDADVEAVFARADAALYAAKQAGRNRVVGV